MCSSLQQLNGLEERMGTTSKYVLERRANPSLRDVGDIKRLALAEAKRQRRRLRRSSS